MQRLFDLVLVRVNAFYFISSFDTWGHFHTNPRKYMPSIFFCAFFLFRAFYCVAGAKSHGAQTILAPFGQPSTLPQPLGEKKNHGLLRALATTHFFFAATKDKESLTSTRSQK